MTATLDLPLLRDALASSTLSHGLQAFGDRWTVAILQGAFRGIRRFDDWQTTLGLPRQTLSSRLRSLVEHGMMRQRPYQEGSRRQAYHLTRKALGMYGAILMIWAWERRWSKREVELPRRLVHKTCGHAFMPELQCRHCSGKTRVSDLHYSMEVNPELLKLASGFGRTPRLSAQSGLDMGLGLLVDRWTLLIVAAVVLGCRHFDELSKVLGIGPSVLTQRLRSMVESQLLLAQPDLMDGRRMVYRLTPASRDLFGYIICFANWTGFHHLQQPSSIRPFHAACGHAFVPSVACDQCHQPVHALDVHFDRVA